MMTQEENKSAPTEEAPIFKSWTAWYILVLGTLLALIACFYLFSKYFQ